MPQDVVKGIEQSANYEWRLNMGMILAEANELET